MTEWCDNMDNIRILHCGNSIENYYTCINEKTVGFMKRFKENPKDTYIYLTVKAGNFSYCGARGILGDLTECKPWGDAIEYKQCFKINSVEYCEPFKINFLSQYLPVGWGTAYLVGAKLFSIEEAAKAMQSNFDKNKTGVLYLFESNGEGKICYNNKDIIDDKIRRLVKLRNKDALTDEEFNQKKEELLKQI